jgi:excisionase family DNA binding protein
MEKLLTAKEVAENFQLDLQAIYRFAREGALPHVRIGERKIRFSERALNDWIAEQIASTAKPQKEQTNVL